MIQPFNDTYFMKKALEQAQLAFDKEEVPIGSVIVLNNQIIAQTHNQTELLKDATAHTEMLSITSAMETLGSKYLKDATIYVTMEPCPMCAGAIVHSQIKKVVFGAYDPRNGSLKYNPSLYNKKIELIGGVLEEDCSSLINVFFKNKR